MTPVRGSFNLKEDTIYKLRTAVLKGLGVHGSVGSYDSLKGCHFLALISVQTGPPLGLAFLHPAVLCHLLNIFKFADSFSLMYVWLIYCLTKGWL